MSLSIKENLTLINQNVNSSRKIDFIVIHYTANNGDTAWGNTNYFKSEYRGASAHYFVDEREIWRSVLDKNTAWHCGTSGTYKHAICRNSNSIGIELCSRKDSKGVYYLMPEVIAAGILLVQELMKKYNIKIENVIRHYDVTGKICPEPLVRIENDWKKFLASCIGTILPPVTPPVVIPSGIEYQVKVTSEELNIRSGAGTNYSISGVIKDKGIYTIVDEANGPGAKVWGKLKSGAGWISLDFTTKEKSESNAPIILAKSNDEIIWAFLKNSGLNCFAVAGIMGNLFAESGLNSIIVEQARRAITGNLSNEAYTAAVDNGTYTNFVRDSVGYGLVQWTYWSRKEALLNFAKASKKSIGDLSMQLDFMWKELQGYTAMMKTIREATTIMQASNAMLFDYERPADQSELVQKKRADYGKVYYDKYADKVVAVQTSYTPSDASLNAAVKLGIVNSPEYWGGISNVQYLDVLFEKVTAPGSSSEKHNNPVNTLDEAIAIFVKAKIMSSPDYWKTEATKSGAVKYLDALLINMAKKICA